MGKNGGKRPKRKIFHSANLIVDIKRRVIVLSGNVDKATSNAFQKAIWKMQNFGSEPITVRIRRGKGGCAIACMMIHGLLRNCFAHTVCIVEDYAYSGSLHILQGAAERVMRKNARLKFHWATVQFEENVWYDIEEITSCLSYLVQMNSRLYDMMQRRTGLPIESIDNFYKIGAIIPAQKALDLSLIDRLV